MTMITNEELYFPALLCSWMKVTCHCLFFTRPLFLFVCLLIFNRVSFFPLWLKKLMIFNSLSYSCGPMLHSIRETPVFLSSKSSSVPKNDPLAFTVLSNKCKSYLQSSFIQAELIPIKISPNK